MSRFKEIVLQMLDKMDDEFKKQNETTIHSYFEQYPVLSLMKDDLLGYLKNEYHRDFVSATDKEKMKQHIENYDDADMEYIARKLAQEPMMYSFWNGIDYWLDKIHDEITREEEED